MEAHKQITVEVLTYAPATFFHCKHCELIWQQTGTSKNFHQEQVASSLPDDLRQEYQQVSDWVRETIKTYGEHVVFRVIDAASLEGWLKSVRYRIHTYPAVVVDHRVIAAGHDFDQASTLIRQRMVNEHPGKLVS